MSSTGQTLSRRRFLRGQLEAGEDHLVIRPPWTNERDVLDHCTACGGCVAACPEKIILADECGKPTVSFADGDCTFCGKCVQACEAPVFDIARDPPWRNKVSITSECLLKSGVTCQLCTDSCDAEALRFDMRQRPAGAVRLDLDACTGCGACLSICPVSAIVLNPPAGDAAT